MSSGLIPSSATIIGQLVAPSGTRMPLHQAAAPLGWTQDVSAAMSDTAMRMHNTSPTTGGSSGFSTWYLGATYNLSTFSLSVSQMPSHGHAFTNNPTHTHPVFDVTNDFGYQVMPGGFSGFPNSTTNVIYTVTNLNSLTDANSTNVSLTAQGSGASITPTYTTPAVKYCDLIMAVKS